MIFSCSQTGTIFWKSASVIISSAAAFAVAAPFTRAAGAGPAGAAGASDESGEHCDRGVGVGAAVTSREPSTNTVGSDDNDVPFTGEAVAIVFAVTEGSRCCTLVGRGSASVCRDERKRFDFRSGGMLDASRRAAALMSSCSRCATRAPDANADAAERGAVVLLPLPATPRGTRVPSGAAVDVGVAISCSGRITGTSLPSILVAVEAARSSVAYSGATGVERACVRRHGCKIWRQARGAPFPGAARHRQKWALVWHRRVTSKKRHVR
eukprot:IDg15102t1